MSLYAITSELAGLIDLAERCANDEEMSLAVAEHTAAIDEALEAKAEDYASLVKSLEARAAARKEEAARITALAKSDAALADRLKLALRESMTRTGRLKINTNRFRLSVVANGGKIPIVIDDESSIPELYTQMQVSYTIDKEAIRSAIDAGTDVPGARLGVRGTRLDIK